MYYFVLFFNVYAHGLCIVVLKISCTLHPVKFTKQNMKKLILSLAMVAAGSTAFAQISAGTMMLGGTIGFGSHSEAREVSGNPTAANNGTADGLSRSNMGVGLNFGYFIQDNLAVGIGIGYGTSSTLQKSEYDKVSGANHPLGIAPTPGFTAYDDETVLNSSFMVSLFANKYNEINEKWLWYYGAGLGFAMGSSSTTAIEQATPGTGDFGVVTKDGRATTAISVGANLGITYFLSNSWGMSAGLNNLLSLDYVAGKKETKVGPVTTTDTDSDLTLGLGTGSFGVGAVTFGVSYFIGR